LDSCFEFPAQPRPSSGELPRLLPLLALLLKSSLQRCDLREPGVDFRHGVVGCEGGRDILTCRRPKREIREFGHGPGSERTIPRTHSYRDVVRGGYRYRGAIAPLIPR
jgi:hypothetical protein